MAKIDARFLKLDPNTLQDDGSGLLKQVPGTDGAVGFTLHILPLLPTFYNGYVDLPYVPVNFDAVGLYIQNEAGSVSARQMHGVDFTIVRDAFGGEYKRICWNSNIPPNGGNGTAIPDDDLPPTEGMQDILKPNYSFQVRFPD